MAQMGPAKAVMLIVVAQLISAYLIEIFGMFGVEKAVFEWKRLLGLGICIGGAGIKRENSINLQFSNLVILDLACSGDVVSDNAV